MNDELCVACDMHRNCPPPPHLADWLEPLVSKLFRSTVPLVPEIHPQCPTALPRKNHFFRTALYRIDEGKQ
jgi:hypothetical protein